MEKQISEQKQEIKRLSNRQDIQNNDISSEYSGQRSDPLEFAEQYLKSHMYNTTDDSSLNERLCTMPDCNSRANNGSYYCSQHECTVSGCHEQITNDYSQYCLLHQCIIPDCTNERQANSYYCFSHECLYPSCHKKRNSDWGIHCAEHDN